MENDERIKLFLVDDDPIFLKLLEIEFHDSADFIIKTYLTGELCVQNLFLHPHLVILDYQLDGTDKTAMNGLQTLDAIKKFDQEIPVIILSGQDKIEVAIKCMQHKATDYVVKSETAFFRLKQIISKILHSKKIENQLNWYMDRM